MEVKPLLTADELWKLPEKPGVRFELLDGEVVEVPGTGGIHGLIVKLVMKLLDAFVEAHDLGVVYGDGVSYVVKRGPDRVRIPDVSFITWARVPAGGVPVGYLPVSPDLVVEVVSPDERARDREDRIRDYLVAGTQQVWVLWPTRRAVTVRTPDGQARDLGPDDVLDGGDVLPGFRVQVAELFKVRLQRGAR